MLGQDKGPEQVSVGGELLNVAENFTLTDTVMCSAHVNNLATPVPGWFATFAAMGAANKIPFYNVRNRANCDLAWNNQDTRDTAAFGMRITRVGIRWIVPAVADSLEEKTPTPYYFHNFDKGPSWSAILPHHAGFILRVQQDEKLKCKAAMLSSGIGLVLGGWGQGGEALHFAPDTWSMTHSAMHAGNMGFPHIQNQFAFPEVIDIPRRAAISAEIIFSDYARNLLQHMTGPGFMNTWESDIKRGEPSAVFAIQVIISGRRLIQQRGQLHA